MREYVARLPDYTCHLTLERFQRAKSSVPFDLSDRLRLEVAYTSGQELYSWPGDDHFEAGIEDLLPGHGMVSNGSYALHIRNLFERDVAHFTGPVEEACDGQACLRLDFTIPAMHSGFAVGSGGGSAPAPLAGSAWFDPAFFDIRKLEVRVDEAPRNVRIAGTRETTVYQTVRVGEAEFILPATSELVLRDRDGSERWNRTRFERFRRYTGSATLVFGGAEPANDAPKKRDGTATIEAPATLDDDITEDAAIGDEFSVTTRSGAHVTGRITDMRRTGKYWFVELKLGSFGRGTRLPVKAGTRVR